MQDKTTTPPSQLTKTKKAKASLPWKVMILASEGKEEDIGLDVPLPQPPLQDFASAAIATRPVPSTTIEKEEGITVPIEESDRYFLSSSADLTSSPTFSHLEAMHENFNGTFPIDPAVFIQLQKSLLKIDKLMNLSIAPEVKEVCQCLAVKLETLVFNYKVHEKCRSSSLQSLNQLSDLRVQKESLRL